MNKKYSIGMLLMVLSGSFFLFSCGPSGRRGQKIFIGDTVIVPSKHLNREMVIDVCLPEGYTKTENGYPVLFTCQSRFLHVSGIAADLARKSSVPEMLVASVRNYSSEDFIPEKIEGHPNSGNADRFIAFFKDELIPFLDSKYRTQPFRIFTSGSFGGGFCVYAFLTRPDVFNAYLAATPAIDYEGGSRLISDKAASWLGENTYADRFLYMGVENEPMLIPILETFVGSLKKANPDGLKWEYHRFFDEDHGSIPNKVIYHGLRFVFSDWNTISEEITRRGVDSIRAYSNNLRKRFGCDIGLSRLAVSRAVGWYKRQNRFNDAIALLKFNLEFAPNSEMIWLELGRAYESTGQLEEAKATLQTAHQKAVENSSPHLGIFIDALERVNNNLVH